MIIHVKNNYTYLKLILVNECEKFVEYDFEQFEHLQLYDKCNCWHFSKNYICRHVILMAVLNTNVTMV